MGLNKILDHIKEIDVAALTADLVRIPSYFNLYRQEEATAEYIYDYFIANGIEAEMIEVEEGRPNVIAKLPGKGKGNSLLLTGHTDTVPAYDMENAFSGEIRAGILYGRGASDMKGALACMMAAMVGIKNSGVELEGDLYFAGVIDEEEYGKGAKALVKDWCGADATIVGEPTNLLVEQGNRGLEWITITVYGKKVHGATQEQGINAVEMAARLITYMTDEYSKVLKTRSHHHIGPASINIGTITGGDQPSTVPDVCTIQLDRRSVPGETVEQVYGELNDIIDIMAEKYPGFRATVTDMLEGDNEVPHSPYYTSDDTEFVQIVKQVREELQVEERPRKGFIGWSDGGFIAGQTDSLVIVLGPGQPELCHSVKEQIAVKDLETAAAIYGGVALRYCGRKK